MSILKAIPTDSYKVQPIITHKFQTYSCIYGEPGGVVTINVATRPPSKESWNFDEITAVENLDGTLQDVLYKSIQHMFYGNPSQWNQGTAPSIPETSKLYVLSIPQCTYGDTIQVGTFSIHDVKTPHVISDDGHGMLVLNGTPVGHVFYGLGIAVVRDGVDDEVGLSLEDGDEVVVSFRATHTIYEHSVMCTMDIGEFGFTFNPSIKKSVDGTRLIASIADGKLTPYMTTIGLYNNQHELVAVAKFPRPIKRIPEAQQTVIIRWDV